MEYIDLKNIIDKCNLDRDFVAYQLFPTNQFARLALNRIIDGKGVLDANQISKLSFITGLSISELYGHNWTAKTEKQIHTFTNGDYIATLNVDTWTTQVFYKTSLLHEKVLHSKAITLIEFIDYLNLVINYETD